MKKLLLSLTLLTGLATVTLAQDKPVSFGVKAGLALPSQTSSSMGFSYSTSTKTSFYVGAVADFKVSPIFSVQPGLTYVGKGGKVDFGELVEEMGADPSEFGDLNQTIDFSYLELPINLLANFNVGAGKVFVGAGPYAAYALSGKAKVGDYEEDAVFGSGEDEVKRMEFGVNFTGGYQLQNGLNLHVGYGLGLSSLENSSSSKTKNRVFSVGLGFMF